jgi:hypothetical protein
MQVRSSRLQEDSQDTSETESTPRGDAADLDAAAPSTVETPVPSASAEPEVIGFRQWWRELWEIVNHLFVLGGTGSGKTTTVRAMVRYIALVLKHQVVILDPKANVDTWCGLRAQTKAEAIESMLQVLLADFENRLERNATLTEAEAQQAFRHVWIVVDELSFVRDNCPTWQLLIRRLSSMARALNMHLIIINQSATAEEIGLKGRADLLKNFSRLQLSKAVWRGKPASLNLDGEAMTIEWKPVTVLSQKTPVLPPSAGYVAPDLGRQETAPAAAPEAPPAAAGSPAGSGGRSETVANQALRSALAEPTAITPVPKPVEASTASIESTDEKDDLVIALAREGLTQREIQRRLNEKFDSGMNNNRLAELHKKGRALAAAQPPDATGEASTASDVPQAAVGDVSLKKLAAA